MHMPRTIGFVVLALGLASSIVAPSAEAMENEFSIYGGIQESPHSTVDFTDANGASTRFRAGWDGLSFEMPPYYGFRYTRWTNDRFGWGVEFSHEKVYADNATMAVSGFGALELTDGLNILTINAWRRWHNDSAWTPYVGAGIGVAIPHVDAVTPLGNATYGYQYTGLAGRWAAGLSYEVNDSWSIFAEYGGTYSQNDIDLDGGGSMSTDIITNALNIGLTFSY